MNSTATHRSTLPLRRVIVGAVLAAVTAASAVLAPVLLPAPAGAAPAVHGGIGAKYRAIGGSAAVGAPTSAEYRVGGVTVQDFQRGTATWTAASGAHFTVSNIRTHYLRLGGPRTVGAASTDQGRVGIGFFQYFTGANIYIVGSQLGSVRAGFRDWYLRAGGPWSAAGYPVGDEHRVYGVPVQNFEFRTGYWINNGVVLTVGAIRQKHTALGGLTGTGWIGRPTGSESRIAGGAKQEFTGGTIYWHARSGAAVVRGDIRDWYLRAGGPAAVGFPTADQAGAAGGRTVQDFQYRTAYLREGRILQTLGAIRELYRAHGAHGGALGFPTSGEYRQGGDTVQDFEGGQLRWNTARGAWIVTPSGPSVTAGTVTVTGDARVGATLTAATSGWTSSSGAAPTLSYQWLRGGAAISGTTRSTYTVTQADAGARLSVTVTGQLAGHTSASRTSAQTATVPQQTVTAGAVTVSGSAVIQVGGGQPASTSVLTAATSGWSSSSGTAPTLSYQWYLSDSWGENWQPVSGATRAAFTATGDHIGRSLKVRVTGTLPGHASASAESAPLRVSSQSRPATPPITPGTVTISGVNDPVLLADRSYRASVAGWPSDVTLSYQWTSGVNGANPIAGATAATFTVPATASYTTLGVTVTAAKAGATSVSARSSQTVTVRAHDPRVEDTITLDQFRAACHSESLRLTNELRAQNGLAPWPNATPGPKFKAGIAAWTDQIAADETLYGHSTTTFENSAGAFWREIIAGARGGLISELAGARRVGLSEANAKLIARDTFDSWVGSPEHKAELLRALQPGTTYLFMVSRDARGTSFFAAGGMGADL